MACPYFIPTEKFVSGGWPHPSRLPLGAGYRGLCTAACDQQIVPSDQELREFCNLGYATRCPRLPNPRRFDAVRFSVARDRDDRIQVCCVLETAHRPGAYRMLEYDSEGGKWTVTHPDPRIQAMAACYLESYLARRQQQNAASAEA
jgi:hypothetical protein